MKKYNNIYVFYHELNSIYHYIFSYNFIFLYFYTAEDTLIESKQDINFPLCQYTNNGYFWSIMYKNNLQFFITNKFCQLCIEIGLGVNLH